MSSLLYQEPSDLRDAARDEVSAARTWIASNLACAIVNREGIVTQATDVLRAFLPDIIGRGLTDALRMQAAGFADLQESHAPVDAVYRNPDGEPMPAIVQTIHAADSSGDALVLVTDCARFRRMESRRFEATPYTVMRVSEDGIVRFVNAEALKILGTTRDALLGKPLVSGFASDYATGIQKALAACVEKKCSERLPVNLPDAGVNSEDTAELIFTPDVAPDGQAFGAIVVIESTANDRVRNEIAKIALDPCNKVWRERLRLILQKVRQVVDFEHAIFGVYADDLTLFRAVAIFEEHSIDWPARWMVLPPGFVRSWIDAGVYWVEDLETFVDEHEVLRSSEVVQAYLRAGIRSSVTLIVQSNEGPTSALTLCSKAPHQFNEEHCAILREIGLEPVLLRCEAQIRQERQAFAEEVREIVATSDDLAAGCMDIVDKIRTRLDWDFAALFRVDRHQSQFRLVHQSVSDERFREASGTNYVQSIIKGMLGATLQQGTVLTVDSVHAGDADQYGFLRALKGARSVMTVPIRLNHRVRWILHVESAETHCFRGPDQEEVKHLSRLIEAGLAQRMLQEIKAFVMHESERGIVMVGMDGEVLEMNKAAAGMLGRPTLQVTEPFRLSDHAYNDHARAVLDREVNTSNRRIELKGEHGERCLVFATCKDLEESFDTALWFFTDLRKMAWDRDMRFLRETVAEFAQQARPPLSLASSLVRQLPKVIRALMAPQNDEEKAHSQVRAEETCDRIALEIGKADITFERLAEAHAIRQTPMRERQRVNLAHCLDGVIEAFPKRDQRHIDFERDAQAVCIMGDEGRLSFVVRSILAHLLRTRPFDDTRILTKLSIVDCSDRPEQTALVRLCFQLSGPVETARTSRHPGRQDALQAAYDEARSDASLAFDAIWRVVHAHDGLIETEPPESFRRDPSVIVTSFAMRFPACTDRRIKNEAE